MSPERKQSFSITELNLVDSLLGRKKDRRVHIETYNLLYLQTSSPLAISNIHAAGPSCLSEYVGHMPRFPKVLSSCICYQRKDRGYRSLGNTGAEF
jgi:hypothetical protein